MQAVWFKDCKTSEERESRVKQLRAFRPAFELLKEILAAEYPKKEAVRDYDSPGWANRQIAINEYNQVLDDVVKLITLKES